MDKLTELKSSFTEIFGGDSSTIKSYFSPGRVNLIGEHIDYNGGFVFPGALTLGITGLYRKTEGNIIRLRSMNIDGEITIDINSSIDFKESDSWGNYPKGVFNFLKKEGYSIPAGDFLFYSTVPDGSGLSSSAALEVLTAYMVLHLTNQKIDRVWLSQFTQRVENQYVGVNCGIMDQFSVANGKKNHAILLNCETLDFTLVPFDLGEYSLVIMNTNKKRELADSKYNERRAECDEVLVILNKENQYLNLCDASIEQVDKLVTNEVLHRRARHVVTENVRVLESVKVLKEGNLKEFGILLNASHKSLKEDYEVTGLELDSIVAAAVEHPDCLGARMTGAGFGGCAIAVVLSASVPEFIEEVKAEYLQAVGLEATFHISSIGDGVHFIE
ncbi:MAG TPA: galactokinase [Cytophagaceae bacterium]|jgi:galactokinase